MTSIPYPQNEAAPMRRTALWTPALLVCCLYAIAVNFEQVVDIAVFKPYRIIGVFLVALVIVRRLGVTVDQIARATYAYIALGLTVAGISQFTMGGSMASAVNEASLWLFCVTTYVAVISAISSRRQLNWLLAIFIVALVGSVFDMALHARELFFQGIQGRRVTGAFRNPANACVNILLLVVILLALIRHWSDRTRSGILRTLSIPAALVVLGGLTFVATLTGSRSGMMVYVLGVVAYLLLTRQWRLLLVAGILVAGVVALKQDAFDAKSNILAYRLETKGLNDSRVYLWMAGVNALTDTYGFGLGAGQYRLHHRQYYADYSEVGDSRWAENDLTLHNEYLSALVEYGALGFCLYLTIWAMIFKRCLSVRNTHVRAIGCAVALAAAINAATHHALAYFGLWFFLALLAIWTRIEDGRIEPARPTVV